jgi:hypothetical protein
MAKDVHFVADSLVIVCIPLSWDASCKPSLIRIGGAPFADRPAVTPPALPVANPLGNASSARGCSTACLNLIFALQPSIVPNALTHHVLNQSERVLKR